MLFRSSLTVSLKSVNHRYFDLQMRLPAELEPFEMAARQLIKQKVSRGALQLNASLEMRGTASLRIKRQMVEAYLEAYRQLARENSIATEPDLNALFRLPGVMSFGEPDADQSAALEKLLLAALEQALAQLAQVRARRSEERRVGKECRL